MDCVDRPEEPMRLQDKLPAESILIVDEQYVDTTSPKLDCGGQAGWAAAEDEDVDLNRVDVLHLRR